MVRGRLRSLVNIVLVAGVESSMLRRVAVVGACVLGAGLFATSLALAEDLNPDQARAFVVGKLFSYTCFEGTAGSGRVASSGELPSDLGARNTATIITARSTTRSTTKVLALSVAIAGLTAATRTDPARRRRSGRCCCAHPPAWPARPSPPRRCTPGIRSRAAPRR